MKLEISLKKIKKLIHPNHSHMQ